MFWKTIKLSSITITLVIGLFFVTSKVLAASTGTIDSIYKYAWGENIGWLNFGADEGNVLVTDSELSGYVWGENVGWISLNCSNANSCGSIDYKVKNDGAGNLSGYGWGENVGWLNFNPTYGGVNIGGNGVFTGYAWSENTNWIVFNCATTSSCDTVDYGVKTDYRPQGVRPQCNNASDDDGDGLVDYPADPGCDSISDDDESQGGGAAAAPGGGAPSFPYEIIINRGEEYTNQRKVILSLRAGADIKMMAIANSFDFTGISQEPYLTTKIWDLCGKQSECPAGEYIVYVKFYDQYGRMSSVYVDSIILDYGYAPEELFPPEEKEVVFPKEEELAPKPVFPPSGIEPEAPPPPLQKEEKKISEKIIKTVLDLLPDALKKILPKVDLKLKNVPLAEKLVELLPEFLRPGRKEIESLKVPARQVVPLQTPLAMRGIWELIERAPVKEFVFAPLPENIEKLTRKFPKLKETFEQVGVSKFSDVSKLTTVEFGLSGLTKTVDGRPTVGEEAALKLPGGVPLAQLSAAAKQKIPSEIIFAKTGGELIDFDISLTIDKQGAAQQKIFTVAARQLTLVVKPRAPVRGITGYLTFNRREYSQSGFKAPLDSLFSSRLFAKPVLAQEQFAEIKIERKLVLQEFAYTDPDGDGLYTAEIQTPVADGEYEVVTIIDYLDPSLGARKISLLTVIDPEGYVYEKFGAREVRVPGAVVSIYRFNPQSEEYELWPAREYQQKNPQTTDVTGRYSFLVPEGRYYIMAEAGGYLPYKGELFSVQEGRGVHFNIEMKSKYWWLKTIDWKTIALIIVILFLLYNFYKDRKRDLQLKFKAQK